MKKKITVILCCILLLVTLLPLLSACNNERTADDRLVVYNWEDYIDKDLLKEFEEYYKSVTGRTLSVVYTTYDTNETMMTKFLKNDAADVDLICPSEYAIEKLLTAGYLVNQQEILKELEEKYDLEAMGLGFENMSSLGQGWGNVEDDIMDVIDEKFGEITDKNGTSHNMTEYMVPYMWGTLGILYNTAIVSEEELEQYGWGVLWNVQKNKKLENNILVKDSVRDTYAAAVLYMQEYGLLPEGYENLGAYDLINCTDDEMIAAAEAVLTEQREHISGYEVDFGKDDMINEIVYADLAWSGDALWAIEEGDYDKETDTYQLGYYVPERSNIWYDGWCIPTSVKNKLGAMMFIDFMCENMSGIRNSMHIGYSSALDKESLMSDEEVCAFIEECEYNIDEYFSDGGRYPEITENLGVMRDFGGKNDVLVQMWQRAKSGKKIDPSLWWILLAIVLAGGALVGGYFLYEALKRAPKKLPKKSESEIG